MLVCYFHNSLPSQSSLPASLLLHIQVLSCVDGFTLEVKRKAHDPIFLTFEVACLTSILITIMMINMAILYRHRPQNAIHICTDGSLNSDIVILHFLYRHQRAMKTTRQRVSPVQINAMYAMRRSPQNLSPYVSPLPSGHLLIVLPLPLLTILGLRFLARLSYATSSHACSFHPSCSCSLAPSSPITVTAGLPARL